MPITAHQIRITCPVELKETMEFMVSEGKMEDFAKTFARLLALFTDYLSSETGDERMRTATLWPNVHEKHDFFWSIQEEPLHIRSRDQKRRFLLVGGLHYHQHDKTWSINT